MRLKYLLSLILAVLCFMFYASAVSAADYHTDYQVEYTLSEQAKTISSKVDFKIQITNFRSDIFVSKFAISFPKTFLIHNLIAADDNGPINPKMTVDQLNSKIEMEFSNPKTGKGSVNNFHLQFDQDNLFKVSGNVWEVILPTIDDRQDSIYKVIVNLPSGTKKKISIAKPKPDFIQGNQIVWNNPSTKTIYAVFGDNQIYQLELTYHLKNPRLTPVYTDIAFPPDTENQKIYVGSINPAPVSVSQDEDGNFLGRYILAPAETRTVIFSGTVQLFSRPRDEVIPVMRNLIAKQKDYLLTATSYWQIKSLDKIDNLKSVGDIFYFAVNNLKYNYKRAARATDRLGAQAILSQPDQAVCTEFTDLFVATAREKGIYARELEGYGFSQDPQLRPLSLLADVLHAWPEFYDPRSEIWTQVDPTWQNTSGIDYLSSLDLNHIVFAIHGKRPDYPLPAGMYKTENSHDILVTATTTLPQENISVGLDKIDVPNRISDNKTYQAKLKVVNSGNVFVWNIPVEISGKNVDISSSKVNIESLAPSESREIIISYTSKLKNVKSDGSLTITVAGKKELNANFLIFPYYYDLSIKIAGVILIASIIFLLSKYVIFRRK